MMKSPTKTDCDKIDEIHRKEVELAISKINVLLNKDIAEENYEDCSRLRDMIPKFESFLKNVPYSEIKDDLYFAKSKITVLLKDALSKPKNKGKK